MWNNDSWRLWDSHQPGPMRSQLHRSAPIPLSQHPVHPPPYANHRMPQPLSYMAPVPRPLPMAPLPMRSNPMHMASTSHRSHPYQRPFDRRAAPYARPTFFGDARSTLNTRRNPLERPDFWTPRAVAPVVPMTTPHIDLWTDFDAPAKPIEVTLYAKKSAKQCSVRFDKVELPPQHTHSFSLNVYENHRLLDTTQLERNTCEYSFKTVPGEWYSVEYRVRNSRGINTAEGSIRFRASFSMMEMKQLYDRALEYCANTCIAMHPFRVLYRCKPQCYWDDIQARSNNIMRKYIKDDNGQAANPTNGMIYGLFFSARLLPNGLMPPSSPFGNIRMQIPAQVLLDPERVNMYFSDFYCNRLTHYVTIVICVIGSRTDVYCKEKLVPVPMNNPFLRIRSIGPGLYEFYVNKKLWIEIYFTENVPLSWGKFDRVIPVGLGTSRLGGLPHNKNCTICNLYPVGGPLPTFADENRGQDADEKTAEQLLKKMTDSMKNTGLPLGDREEIVFLVSGLVDQVSYDTDLSFNIKNGSAIFGTEVQPVTEAFEILNNDKMDHPKTRGIIAKLRSFTENVSKRIDRVQAVITKKKKSIKTKFTRNSKK